MYTFNEHELSVLEHIIRSNLFNNAEEFNILIDLALRYDCKYATRLFTSEPFEKVPESLIGYTLRFLDGTEGVVLEKNSFEGMDLYKVENINQLIAINHRGKTRSRKHTIVEFIEPAAPPTTESLSTALNRVNLNAPPLTEF